MVAVELFIEFIFGLEDVRCRLRFGLVFALEIIFELFTGDGERTGTTGEFAMENSMGVALGLGEIGFKSELMFSEALGIDNVNFKGLVGEILIGESRRNQKKVKENYPIVAEVV